MISKQYSSSGKRAFDAHLMSKACDKTFIVNVVNSPDEVPENRESDLNIGGHLDGCRIGLKDRVRIDPEVWAQLAGCVERRETIRATHKTFDGRVSEYELHPYHLLAYQGNWYALALNTAKSRIETFALSRFRRIEATGQCFTCPAEFNPER